MNVGLGWGRWREPRRPCRGLGDQRKGGLGGAPRWSLLLTVRMAVISHAHKQTLQENL